VTRRRRWRGGGERGEQFGLHRGLPLKMLFIERGAKTCIASLNLWTSGGERRDNGSDKLHNDMSMSIYCL